VIVELVYECAFEVCRNKALHERVGTSVDDVVSACATRNEIMRSYKLLKSMLRIVTLQLLTAGSMIVLVVNRIEWQTKAYKERIPVGVGSLF
jgi:hypothetical protein